jgi:hypothetical protein
MCAWAGCMTGACGGPGGNQAITVTADAEADVVVMTVRFACTSQRVMLMAAPTASPMPCMQLLVKALNPCAPCCRACSVFTVPHLKHDTPACCCAWGPHLLALHSCHHLPGIHSVQLLQVSCMLVCIFGVLLVQLPQLLELLGLHPCRKLLHPGHQRQQQPANRREEGCILLRRRAWLCWRAV